MEKGALKRTRTIRHCWFQNWKNNDRCHLKRKFNYFWFDTRGRWKFSRQTINIESMKWNLIIYTQLSPMSIMEWNALIFQCYIKFVNLIIIMSALKLFIIDNFCSFHILHLRGRFDPLLLTRRIPHLFFLMSATFYPLENSWTYFIFPSNFTQNDEVMK